MSHLRERDRDKGQKERRQRRDRILRKARKVRKVRKRSVCAHLQHPACDTQA